MTSPSFIDANSMKLLCARNFLRSLSRINSEKKPSKLRFEEGRDESRNRVKKIKIAAYSSMARAAGTNVGWSKAMLSKLRSRRRSSRKKLIKKNKKKMKKRQRTEPREGYERLRKVVPGGEAMDTCYLIDQAAHYIQCLSAQVKVMQSIADELST